ncbi:MAG: thioredoxin-dependent thiol peroxidase [Tepidisphaeraceae bacterium]
MPVLTANTAAPKFSLAASDGSTVSSDALKGKKYVLYFYPKADTPGCTKETCGFRDALAGYKELNVPVFGISPDPVKDVTKFAQKFDVNFPLLADEDHSIAEAFGVWGEKAMYGKKYMGVLRTTFVVDEKGTIAKVFESVKPEGHDQEVLAYLKGA